MMRGHLRNQISSLLKSLNYLAVVELKLPAFSPTMTEGKITQWLVKEGQEIKQGQSIALIETDKATIDFEMIDDMVLARIVKGEADGKIQVGDTIAYAVDSIQELSGFKIPGEPIEPKSVTTKPDAKIQIEKLATTDNRP